MKEYDVLIEFLQYKHRELYTVDANSKEEAKQDALEWAKEDLSVVDVEEVNECNDFKKNLYPKFKHYLLRQVYENGEVWTLMEDKNISDLVRIAERISLPDADKVEVVGTNEPINSYKSWSVIFTREL